MNALSNGTIPDPLRPQSSSPRLGVLNPHPKLQSLLSQEQVKLRTSNLAGIFTASTSEQKPIKSFGENEAWAYPGTAQIFWVPPIISGTGKATNFKSCTHIHRIDRNKSPL